MPSDGQEADDEEQTHSIDHLGTTSDGNSLKALTSNPASSYNSKGLPVRMVSFMMENLNIIWSHYSYSFDYLMITSYVLE